MSSKQACLDEGCSWSETPTQAPEMREALLCSEGFLASEALRLELAMSRALACTEFQTSPH